MASSTQAERLSKMEAILERLETKVDRLDERQTIGDRDIARMRNLGAGILIGVTLLAGAIGSNLSDLLQWLTGRMH